MSSRAIVPITCEKYTPTFDIILDEYYDESPVKSRERNSIIYTCPCKSGSNLRTHTDFIKHFDTDHHKSYLKNYSNIAENEESKEDEKNELKIQNELLKRLLDIKNKNIEEKNKNIEEKDKKIKEKDKKIKKLYKIIDHIENIIGVEIKIGGTL